VSTKARFVHSGGIFVNYGQKPEPRGEIGEKGRSKPAQNRPVRVKLNRGSRNSATSASGSRAISLLRAILPVPSTTPTLLSSNDISIAAN
jgi:hypothetical protein